MDEVSQVLQRPHKRTDVWSSETVSSRTKNSMENSLKRLFRNDKNVAETNFVEEEDELSLSQNRDVSSINTVNNHVKYDFSKVFHLKDSSNVNLNLLLSHFNHVEDIKEDDSVWSEDLLFTEIVNKLKILNPVD